MYVMLYKGNMVSDFDRKLIKKTDKPVLVFDRNSELGRLIAEELAKGVLCVYLSEIIRERSENIIHIPLTKKIPAIPKCVYSTFILNYHNDQTVLDLLPFFISKAVEDNAHIYLIINIHDASEKLINQISDKSTRITILLTGDLIGEGINESNQALDLITQAGTGKIVLSNLLSYIYPAGISDTVAVIKRLTGLKGVPGHRILYLLPPHPVTALSFVRMLQKKEPLIKVDILENQDTKNRILNLKSYASVFGLKYCFEKFLPEIKIKKPKKVVKINRKKRNLNFRAGRLILILLFSVIVTVFSLPLFSAIIGASYLSRTKDQIMSNNLTKARSSAYTASVFFNLSQRSISGLALVSRLGLAHQFDSISSGVYTGKVISDTALSAIDGVVSVKKVVTAKSMDPKSDLYDGIKELKQAVLGLSSLQAERKISENYSQYLNQFEDISGFTDGVFDVLPELLGIESKKKYLVLFQNNMELRPGGGFIGSFGVLEMDKGKITDFPIHDVYDADGQLSQHIEPPFQLRKYMGVSHWYLRDSNFDLEFEKNGASAAFFYNAETKDTADGVIAIDVSFLKKLLSVTGPLRVAGYRETVTSDNFFKLTESYAQDNFFPGSNQKQNFLSAVAVSLFAKLQEEQGVSYTALARVISESIREKHLLFAFARKDVQRIFNTNRASSSIDKSKIVKENVFNDFLGINEANIGMNKVNYYLDRSISHKVELSSDGRSEEAVSVHYINKSKKTDKYGGDYKAYLRFILPKNALLQGVAIGEAVQEVIPAVIDPVVFSSPGYKPQAGLEVEKTELDDNVVYGFLILVPQGSRKTITINYNIQSEALLGIPTLDYSLRLFKQPGTEADSYSFSFVIPKGYKIINSANEIKTNNSGASLLTKLSEDREINLKLSKK